MSKYISWVKKDLFGCFRIEKNVTMAMKQVWKREKEYKCQSTSAFHIRDARSPFAFWFFIYLPSSVIRTQLSKSNSSNWIKPSPMSDREESTIKVLAMFNDSKALHVRLICRIPKLPILLLLTFKEINLRNILSSVSKTTCTESRCSRR